MSVQGSTTGPAADPSAAFNSMEMFMGNLERSLGKSLQPLEKVAKQMGGSKFGKNAKALGSAMKGMAGASVQAWAMEQLMKLIEPFMKLLQLLEIPINILSAMLSVMVNEIFVQLLPYILVFSMYMLKLMPYFKIAGEWIGKYLIVGIQKLIEWIVIGVKWVKEAGIKIGGFFTGLWDGVKTFAGQVSAIWMSIFGPQGFFVNVFHIMVNFVKGIINGVIGIINSVTGAINKIPGVNIAAIPKLAQGGFTTGGGLAELHKNEFVVPLDRAPEFGKDPALLAEMEEQNRLLGRILRNQKETSAWQL